MIQIIIAKSLSWFELIRTVKAQPSKFHFKYAEMCRFCLKGSVQNFFEKFGNLLPVVTGVLKSYSCLTPWWPAGSTLTPWWQTGIIVNTWRPAGSMLTPWWPAGSMSKYRFSLVQVKYGVSDSFELTILPGKPSIILEFFFCMDLGIQRPNV